MLQPAGVEIHRWAEELPLLIEVDRIEAGAQQSEDDERALMGRNGDRDEVEVSCGNRLVIHARDFGVRSRLVREAEAYLETDSRFPDLAPARAFFFFP